MRSLCLSVLVLLSLTHATCLAQDADALKKRLVELEDKLDVLTHRLDRLEMSGGSSSGLKASVSPVPQSSSSSRKVEWQFDDYLSGSPFRVTAMEVDKRRGSAEILLGVTELPADAAAWPTDAGQPVPLVLIARDSTAGVAAKLPLHLVRASKLEPGAHVHVRANLSQEVLGLVRLIRVERSATVGR